VAFPAVAMAKQVGRAGATYPAVFNAANEEAVAAFHARTLPFLGITDIIDAVVQAHHPGEMTLEGVLEAERWARRAAGENIAKHSSTQQ
jgi:1-deoxy-D-xylulose-5-phosphate reductoisomerase